MPPAVPRPLNLPIAVRCPMAVGALYTQRGQPRVPQQRLTLLHKAANVLSFEMPPELAASDFYTMAEGSGAQTEKTTPSPAAIGQIAQMEVPPPPTTKIPFAEPSKDQGMIDLLNDLRQHVIGILYFHCFYPQLY